MRYGATLDTLDHIAALVYQQRPGWDPGLVKIVLRDLAPTVDGSDLAVAAIRAAMNDDLPGPKSIAWRGPHWRDLRTLPPDVKRKEWCAVCGRPENVCYSARHGDDDHAFEPTTKPVRNVR